jgi:hypothetical protein
LLGTVFPDALVRAKPARAARRNHRRIGGGECDRGRRLGGAALRATRRAPVDESERLVGVLTIDDIATSFRSKKPDEILAPAAWWYPEEELNDNFWWIVRSFTCLFIYMLAAFITSVLKTFSCVSDMVAKPPGPIPAR